MAKLTRDGHLVSSGTVRPIREPLPFRERLVIGLVLILAVAVVMLSRSYGQPVNGAEQGVEEDDAPRGDR